MDFTNNDLYGQICGLRIARKLGPTMTPQALQCLLEVALHPGITMEILSDALDIEVSSVSRNLAALGGTTRTGEDGLGLIEKVKDPDEGRRYLAYLTPKGHQFIAKYLNAIHSVRVG